MSTADPFLPEPVPTDADDAQALQPEDYESQEQEQPDVFLGEPEDGSPADAPPVSGSVFRTPTGEATDPAEDV